VKHGGVEINRFNRFAILQKWDFQNPENCVFHIEKISKQGGDIPGAVDDKIRSDLFDQTDFKKFVLQRAKDSDFIGSVMDDLTSPPPTNTDEAIPFLGETKAYECILDIAAQGDIVLNVSGAWIGRRSEDESDEDALRYIHSKAYRTGQEMRQIQLGLPVVVGGGAIAPGMQPVTPVQPISQGGGQTGGTTPAGGSDGHTGNAGVGGIGEVRVGMTQTKRSDEPATGINLFGYFERWGIAPTQIIDSAKIDFSELPAHQIKQILQRIPPTIKAKLEITYKGGDEE